MHPGRNTTSIILNGDRVVLVNGNYDVFTKAGQGLINGVVNNLVYQVMQAFFANVAAGFEAIPGELWMTFAAGYLGYTGFRSFEKVKGRA